jgi:predicted RNA polymerase sigma factor
MVATLTRLLGVHNLSLAEDVVRHVFCRASGEWQFRGVPNNPSAWLMAAAKDRGIDVVRESEHYERSPRNSGGCSRASGRSSPHRTRLSRRDGRAGELRDARSGEAGGASC